MSAFVLVCIGLAAGLAAAVWLIERYDRGAYNKPWQAWTGWLLGWACALSLIGCALIAVVVYPSRAVGKTICRKWGAQTGYKTKFRVLYWADTGTCLAQTEGGRWVKNTHIIINVPESGR